MAAAWLLLLLLLLDVAVLRGCRVAQSQSLEPRRGMWNDRSLFCVRFEYKGGSSVTTSLTSSFQLPK